jgi:hypothetical protein
VLEAIKLYFKENSISIVTQYFRPKLKNLNKTASSLGDDFDLAIALCWVTEIQNNLKYSDVFGPFFDQLPPWTNSVIATKKVENQTHKYNLFRI